MKILALLSAGALAAAVAVPAVAQTHSTRVVTTTTTHTERHSGYRPHTRQVCKVTYRHHRRVRTCRTVRS